MPIVHLKNKKFIFFELLHEYNQKSDLFHEWFKNMYKRIHNKTIELVRLKDFIK